MDRITPRKNKGFAGGRAPDRFPSNDPHGLTGKARRGPRPVNLDYRNASIDTGIRSSYAVQNLVGELVYVFPQVRSSSNKQFAYNQVFHRS